MYVQDLNMKGKMNHSGDCPINLSLELESKDRVSHNSRTTIESSR